MTINELIKIAINDAALRIEFFADPVATCARYGIPVDSLVVASSNMNPKKDPSIMQGGYRP